MKRRILSIITALALCLSLLPATALAAEGEPNTGLCDHHPVHTAECGYTAPTEGHPCGHEHTDECYTEETLCVHTHDETCYSDGKLPTEGEDKAADTCAHVCTEESGCVTRTPDCHHAHDEECGYVQAGHGTPCGYECPICPIEALIAALPDEVTEDNADEVRGQLDEILALFSALSEDEQALVSISRCEALQEALDGASKPDPTEETIRVTVKIGDAEPIGFTGIRGAWKQIGTTTDPVVVTVTDNTSIIDNPLIVESGQNVTVEIKAGVTLSADTTDCFQVKGGTLTLAGEGKVSVEARTTTSSVVYAQSGTLKVTGGTYSSSYNCFWIDKDANVELTGGRFSAISNAELRYGGGRKVKEMLPPQYALSRDEKKVLLSDLDSEEFKKDGVYTVVPCKHEPKEGPIASNGNGTHGVNCLYCPYEQNYGPHEFTDGSGKCVICGAPRFAVTVTETTETGDGTSADYETIESAWAALEGKTGKVHVQDSVTITNPLTVGEGMNVTVTMGVGASITSEVADCFQVQGGTLTLESGTVVEKGDYKSAVSAESGTLNVTGGSYTSTNGNCLWIDEGADVELTGGTFTASGTLLRYENKTASDMLPQDFALSIDGTDTGRIPVSQFSSVTFSDSNVPYTVVACTYNEGCTSLGDGTHITGKCPYCSHGSDLNAQPAPHTFENGVCTACGAEARVRVVKDGLTTEYETIETAWKRGGEITLLKNVTTNETLSTRNIYSVTLKMEQGVTLTSTAGNCFDVYNNHSLTLDLTGGTVNCNNLVQINNGHFKVTGGTYNISGSGISSAANNDIQLSGGTFKASGRLLSYANKEVSAMLADGYSLETDSEKVPLDDLKQFNGSFGEFSGDGKTYTVTSCNHPSLTSSLVSNGDGTHSANCQYCSYRLDPVVHTYDPESGTCTGCHETLGVSVEHDGKTLYYENLDTAWPTILGMSETNNTATVTLLQSETRTASLLIGKDESPNKVSHNVTFKMADGVTLTNNGYSCFKVRNGKLTLDLNDNNTLVQKK